MPELPEVQSVVDALSPILTGQTISQTELLRPDIVSFGRFQRVKKVSPSLNEDLPSLLQHRAITRLYRRAKRIILALDDTSHLYFHLGMTGNLTLNPTSTLPHTHLILTLQSPAPRQTTQVSFSDPRRFGQIVYIPPGSPPDHDLGPEPLSLTPAHLGRLLASARRPLKSALLDQSLIAGLGNIYVDESLHAARLHPQLPANTLTPAQTASLCRHIQRILRKAIAARGSTLRDYRTPTGESGGFQLQHKVYDRQGLPCTTCKTPILRILHSGRSTHLCPSCQRLPRQNRRTFRL